MPQQTVAFASGNAGAPRNATPQQTYLNRLDNLVQGFDQLSSTLRDLRARALGDTYPPAPANVPQEVVSGIPAKLDYLDRMLQEISESVSRLQEIA